MGLHTGTETARRAWSRRTQDAERRGAFYSLRYRDYRLPWFGALLSNLGTWMQSAALSWYVLLATGSAVWVSVVYLASFLPMVLCPSGGVLADRANDAALIHSTGPGPTWPPWHWRASPVLQGPSGGRTRRPQVRPSAAPFACIARRIPLACTAGSAVAGLTIAAPSSFRCCWPPAWCPSRRVPSRRCSPCSPGTCTAGPLGRSGCCRRRWARARSSERCSSRCARVAPGWVAVTLAGAGIALLALSAGRSFAAGIAASAALGAGYVLTMSGANGVIQTSVPDRVRGRVMSLFLLSFGLMLPVGAVTMDAIADAWGAPAATAIAGCVSLVSAAGLRVAVARAAPESEWVFEVGAPPPTV